MFSKKKIKIMAYAFFLFTVMQSLVRAFTPADSNRLKSQNIAKNSPKQLIAASTFGRTSQADEQ
jgi:hypothetical protein